MESRNRHRDSGMKRYRDNIGERRSSKKNKLRGHFSERKRTSQKRNRTDDLVQLFKKKLRIEDSDEESSEASSEESLEESSEESSGENSEYDYAEMMNTLEECLNFFTNNAPNVAMELMNRQGQPTSVLMRTYLNKVIRNLGIVDSDNKLLQAGHDMAANCSSLQELYYDYPGYFASI
jgi:hypothetical protein